MSTTDSTEDNAQPIADAVSGILEQGSTAALVTLVQSTSAVVGAKLIVTENGSLLTGSFGNNELDQAAIAQAGIFLQSKIATRLMPVKEFASPLTELDATLLFERIQPEPRIVICGAGHVGASLAKLASLLGYRATLIDDRAEFLSRALFPEETVELMATDNWSQAVAAALGNGHGVSVAIVTRGHSEDEQCLRAVLNSAEVDYLGLIGSKRRTNIVLQRLRDGGADEEKLAKVHAPVGLDIGAVTPEEVALAILAEVVAVRRGGKGGSLSWWRKSSATPNV